MAGSTDDQFFAQRGNAPIVGNERKLTEGEKQRVWGLVIAEWARLTGGVQTAAESRAGLVGLLILLGNVGTGKVVDYSSYSLPLSFAGATQQVNMASTIQIIRTQSGTLRRFARAFAHLTLRVAKARAITFEVGASHGMSAEYGYLGFDFVDGVPNDKLSEEERIAIDAAKQVGLFRGAHTKQLNTTAHFTGATSTVSGGHVESNAKRIAFS